MDSPKGRPPADKQNVQKSQDSENGFPRRGELHGQLQKIHIEKRTCSFPCLCINNIFIFDYGLVCPY